MWDAVSAKQIVREGMASNKYCEYFDVNESYFPCIDESAINAGAPWETTYPHET